MQHEPNYQPEIHDRDYLRDFRSPQIDYRSMLQDWSRKTEKLDGLWHYAVDQYDSFLRGRWFEKESEDACGNPIPLDHDYEQWETIQLPCSWNLAERELFWYEGPMLFTRCFEYRENPKKKRVFLKTGATNYLARLFLNDRFIGVHTGGSSPFFVELDPALLKQGKNRILYVVDNTRSPQAVPMDNTDWFNYGGIYRSIELIRVPETCIKDYFISLVPDGLFNKIHIEVWLDGPQAELEVDLQIPDLGISERIKTRNSHGQCIINAEPELWTPEHPRCYPVFLECGEDRLGDEIGFREIRVEGTEVLLNGQALFFRGISLHEDSLVNGKAVSIDEFKETLETVKELGCNYLRLAHYPHNSAFARLADKAGIMLWQEIPVYWAIQFEKEAVLQNAENQLSELILANRNRASTVIWSVGNENPDTDERLAFMSRLAQRARELDPTRPVSAACLVNHRELRIEDRLSDHLDIIGINQYYGWYNPRFEELPKILEQSRVDKPVFITEFGAGALAGHHGSNSELFTEEHQAAVYRKQIEMLRNIAYIKGISPWILYDFRCPRRTNAFQRYFNRKGLCAANRKTRKMAFFELQNYYKSF